MWNKHTSEYIIFPVSSAASTLSPFLSVAISRGPVSVWTTDPEGKHPAPVPTEDSVISKDIFKILLVFPKVGTNNKLYLV